MITTSSLHAIDPKNSYPTKINKKKKRENKSIQRERKNKEKMGNPTFELIDGTKKK